MKFDIISDSFCIRLIYILGVLFRVVWFVAADTWAAGRALIFLLFYLGHSFPPSVSPGAVSRAWA